MNNMKWDSNLYDRQHSFVSRYGEALIELLNPVPGEHILDLGCGTGDLAALIQKKGAIVTGMDHSADMVETARKKYPHIRFDTAAAETFQYEEKFDAVFSNATLHWITEPAKTVQRIYDVLKPGGRLVAEMGGKGNVSGIIQTFRDILHAKGYAANAAKTVWYFPALGEYAALLERYGFRVEFAALFERPTPLQGNEGMRNWLHQFGLPLLEGINENERTAIIREVESQIWSRHYSEEQWYADYVRLRIVAVK